MLRCAIPNALYNLFGNIGVFDLPLVGDPLLNLFTFIFDAIGCH